LGDGWPNLPRTDGYSGRLVIENFRRDPDQKLSEPVWHRLKDGNNATEPSSIRADFDTFIHNLLTLGEDVLVSCYTALTPNRFKNFWKD
jgi:hypothetical protein